MKLKAYLLLSVAFLLCTATSCPQDYDVYILDMEVSNFDNSGADMFVSEEPINKNAYVIGINYLVGFSKDDERPHRLSEDFYDEETIKNPLQSIKILCNTNFNDEYPAGSEITNSFRIVENKKLGQDILLILQAHPATGNHSFKVILNCSDGQIVEKDVIVTLF